MVDGLRVLCLPSARRAARCGDGNEVMKGVVEGGSTMDNMYVPIRRYIQDDVIRVLSRCGPSAGKRVMWCVYVSLPKFQTREEPDGIPHAGLRNRQSGVARARVEYSRVWRGVAWRRQADRQTGTCRYVMVMEQCSRR